MSKLFRSIRSFPEIASLIAEETATTDDRFLNAFASNLDGFRIGRDGEDISTDMPDATQAQLAVELIIATIFDVLRDTRLEPAAERLAWGVVHSFHRVSDQWKGVADKAAREVQDLLRSVDGSEIHSVELEAAHDALTLFDEATDALACMRDHAAEAYDSEVGKPWSGPKGTLVSSKRTAAVIKGSDYLAARRQRRIGQHHPDGPLVVFSGGKRWTDHKPIYRALNDMKRLRPNMVLLSTAQDTGGDAITKAWAAKNRVPLVELDIDIDRWGPKRAGFVRNDQIARLQPADAIVAEGTGVQAQLVRVLRAVGVQPVLLTLYGGSPDWANWTSFLSGLVRVSPGSAPFLSRFRIAILREPDFARSRRTAMLHR